MNAGPLTFRPLFFLSCLNPFHSLPPACPERSLAFGTFHVSRGVFLEAGISVVGLIAALILTLFIKRA